MRLAAVAMAAAIHRHDGKARLGQPAIPAGGFPVLHPAGAEAMHQHDCRTLAMPFKGQGRAVRRGHEFGHDAFSMPANLAKRGRPVYKGAMKKWLFIAAINGALAVIAGALAAHARDLAAGARSRYPAGGELSALTRPGHGPCRPGRPRQAGLCASVSAGLFLAGIVLFSGGLYLLALTGAHGFAFMIPFGGAAFIAGWIALAVTALKLEA